MENVKENKEEIRKRIDEVKNLIKANSKDAHHAEKLIDELISLDREKRHEATLVHIPMDNISKTFEGDTFELCYTKQGEAVYRTFGGYTIICSSMFNALNSTISAMIDYLNGDIKEEFTDEHKQFIENDITATSWVLNLPLHACSDLEFKYDLTNRFMEYISKLQEEANTDEPQEETYEEDAQFKDAMIGMENVKEIIGEEVENIKSKE
jgi:hypothetical protein